jgi:multiple sugar transport system substrate-binding protein
MDDRARLPDRQVGITRRELLRRGTLLGLGAAAVPLLAACNSAAASQAPSSSAAKAAGSSAGSAQGLNFTAWEFDPNDLKQIITNWSKSNGVPVNLTILPGGSSYTPTLVTQFQGGADIDLMYQFPYDAGNFLARGWGRDLRGLPGADQMVSEMYPNTRGYYQMADGSILGAPYFNACHVLFYNSAQLQQQGLQPPQTLQDVYDQCKKIKSAGVNSSPYLAYWVKSFMEEYLNVYLIAEGVTMWDGKGNPVFADDPKTLNVMEWWQSMYHDGLTSPTMLTDDPTKLSTLLGTGGATFFVLHHYFMPIIKGLKNAPQVPNIKIAYDRMPGASGKTFQMAAMVQLGSKATGIRANDAWNLMKFFGWKDPSGQMVTFKAWAKYAQLGAPYPAFWKDPEVIADFSPNFDVPSLVNVFENGSLVQPTRTAPWYSQWQATVGDRIQAMLLGQATPSATIQGLVADVKSAQSGSL